MVQIEQKLLILPCDVDQRAADAQAVRQIDLAARASVY